jgi:hypothetical protein
LGNQTAGEQRLAHPDARPPLGGLAHVIAMSALSEYAHIPALVAEADPTEKAPTVTVLSTPALVRPTVRAASVVVSLPLSWSRAGAGAHAQFARRQLEVVNRKLAGLLADDIATAAAHDITGKALLAGIEQAFSDLDAAGYTPDTIVGPAGALLALSAEYRLDQIVRFLEVAPTTGGALAVLDSNAVGVFVDEDISLESQGAETLAYSHAAMREGAVAAHNPEGIRKVVPAAAP